MSQVIVTDDSLKSARERTRAQEHRIETNAEFQKWHKGDVSRLTPILRLVLTPILLPVFVFWTVLLAGVGYGIAFVAGTMKVLSTIFR